MMTVMICGVSAGMAKVTIEVEMQIAQIGKEMVDTTI